MKVDLAKSRKRNRKAREELEKLEFKDRKVYVVTGAGRSGTSFMARCLYEAGVDMGERAFVMTQDYNQDLLYENEEAVEMNQQLLKAAGGNWDRLPKQEWIEKAGREIRPQLQELIRRYQSPFWGMKDPRFSVTASSWLPLFSEDDDVYVIGVFRKPKKVAESLERWHGVDRKKGEALAKEYSRRFVDMVKRFVGLE